MNLHEAKRILHLNTTEEALKEINRNGQNVRDKINEALDIACICIDKVINFDKRTDDDGR